MPIYVNGDFAKTVERAMSNGNDPIYEYICHQCGNEFESLNRNRIYCESEECDGKGIHLDVYLKEQ